MELRPLVSDVETRGPQGKQWRRVEAFNTAMRSMAIFAPAIRSHELLKTIETRVEQCAYFGVEEL